MVLGAPLCPAGHLPRKGGDQQFQRRRRSCNAHNQRHRKCQPISPPEGEEWSAKRTESQLPGFPNNERPERQRRAGSGRTEGVAWAQSFRPGGRKTSRPHLS
ncbi:hypothetical protein FJ434_18355 [Mesorhizobium sp. B2-5-13]|nr:hypothetical protein FJ432_22415 [Mesorhizobium sp. B2-6-5]TPJ84217.1 hypothetical protein FJ434_18355 [Mesorhizobium sp. B2-5-13]TPK46616.1 hypothetical protein FJ560_18370 [Mesorhizobium sp. B2-5-5]